MERQVAVGHGGSPLPAKVRTEFEPRYGMDFSSVRIHTGSTSDRLSRSLGAQAFTYGNDIHFSSGKYDPSSLRGKRLLAHELTHVMQQKGSALKRKVIQRATVDTMDGKWKTREYRPVITSGNPGCVIILEFEPNSLVNSKKIGLMQAMMTKNLNGKDLDLQLQQKKTAGQAMSSGEKTKASRTSGAGHWDRGLEFTNPVYGATNLKKGQGISKTAESKFQWGGKSKQSNYQLGWHYKIGLIKKQRNAILRDEPNMPTAKDNSDMTFETTAMALDGNQKYVHYGTVKWAGTSRTWPTRKSSLRRVTSS